MANIGVLGAGSWGTALSVLLHDNGNQATMVDRSRRDRDAVKRKRA